MIILDTNDIVADARAEGRTIAIADGQIAAVAKIHGFSVATRDSPTSSPPAYR